MCIQKFAYPAAAKLPGPHAQARILARAATAYGYGWSGVWIRMLLSLVFVAHLQGAGSKKEARRRDSVSLASHHNGQSTKKLSRCFWIVRSISYWHNSSRLTSLLHALVLKSYEDVWQCLSESLDHRFVDALVCCVNLLNTVTK